MSKNKKCIPIIDKFFISLIPNCRENHCLIHPIKVKITLVSDCLNTTATRIMNFDYATLSVLRKTHPAWISITPLAEYALEHRFW